jgi:hypothetical protein
MAPHAGSKEGCKDLPNYSATIGICQVLNALIPKLERSRKISLVSCTTKIFAD